MNDNKNSFVVYTEWLELIELLSEDEQLILLKRIFKYERGDEIKKTDFLQLEKLWGFIKAKLDASEAKSERIREAHRKGGKIRSAQLKTAQDSSAPEKETPKEKNTLSVIPAPEIEAPKKKQSSRFIKPTLEEIEAQIFEKGYTVNARRFFNYYESNGWKVGKNTMKSWKAALATWQSKEDEQVVSREPKSFWEVE